MRFDIITLFPSIFDGYLTQGLLAKAIQRDLVQIERHNLRDWAPETPHRQSMTSRLEEAPEC